MKKIEHGEVVYRGMVGASDAIHMTGFSVARFRCQLCWELE